MAFATLHMVLEQFGELSGTTYENEIPLLGDYSIQDYLVSAGAKNEYIIANDIASAKIVTTLTGALDTNLNLVADLTWDISVTLWRIDTDEVVMTRVVAGVTAGTAIELIGALAAGSYTLRYVLSARENKNGGNNNMILGTAIFALGDARYYVRQKFDDAATDAQITAHFDALAQADKCEAKLISVMKSIFYDGTDIPAGDANDEYRMKALVTFGATEEHATVIEIPCLTDKDFNVDAWMEANKADLRNEFGEPGVRAVQVDYRKERKARGR